MSPVSHDKQLSLQSRLLKFATTSHTPAVIVNTDMSLEASGHGFFYREMKPTKQCKISPKNYGQTRGGGRTTAPTHPKYATVYSPFETDSTVINKK